MGQKVNPIGFRLGIVKTWSSRWYADKEYKKFLHEDLRLKKYLKKKMYHAGISKIEIERAAKRIRVNIYAARPGIIIGKKGAEIETLKKDLQKFTSGELFININEVKRPETDAQLIAENVALQLVRRVAFRRAIKRSVGMAMKLGAKGVKVAVSGRLGGAEIARSEWYRDGRVPLHTLRADIDYGVAEAKTTYGIIGIKVWVFKGEMGDAFDEVAFSLDPGQIGGPVKLDNGYAIIQVEEIDPQHPVDEQELETRRQQAFKDWLNAQVAAANVNKNLTPEMIPPLPPDLQQFAAELGYQLQQQPQQ